MPTFPSLSSNASVSHPEATPDWPNVAVEYENGTEEVRSIGSAKRWTFPVIFRVNQTDRNTIATFLDARRLGAERFDYTHPVYGSINVRLKSMREVLMVDGNPYWFEISVELRGQL